MAEKNNFVHGVAYGKLYLAGEYAILEDYSTALLTSVPKKITVTIKPSTKTTITDTLYNETVLLSDEKPHFKLIQAFIKFLNGFTQSDKNFELFINNELHSDNKKYGLGSSGAVLVAIANAILKFEEISFDSITIFKLVSLYNISSNLSGSMGDIAASLNKGLTYYKKFNSSFVENLIKEGKSIREIVESDWDGLEIKTIQPKANIEINARWTGEVVDTKEHVKLWKQNKENFKEQYSKFVSTSNSLVEKLVTYIEEGNSNEALETFAMLRENLHYLESFSNIPMETPAMKNYINSHITGKQSGSGSGDIVLGINKSSKGFNMNLNLEKLK